MTDSESNKGFYIAGIAQGFGCGLGSALLHISEDLDQATCLFDFSSYGMGDMTIYDIAEDPSNQTLYTTMRQSNVVLFLKF